MAASALEAVVVPVAVLEGDEARAADAGDGLAARGAPLGEQIAEALGAAGLLITGREALSGQVLVAVCAGEALAMPWFVLVGYTTALNSLKNHFFNTICLS